MKLVDHILVKTKETKHTVVYTCGEDQERITFYLPKFYLRENKTNPTSIRMIVEEETNG